METQRSKDAWNVALGTFAGFVLGAFVHFPVLLRLCRAGGRVGGIALDAWPVLGGLALCIVCTGLYRLVRRAWPGVRRRAVSWGLLLPGVLAAGASGLWPLVVLAPAARKLGDRRAAALAVAGWIAWVGMGLLVEVPYSGRSGAFWLFAGCGVLGTLLVLESLRRLARMDRAFARLYGAFAMVLAASLATHPAVHAPILQRRGAALLAELLVKTGSPLRHGVPLAGAVPPVASGDDPIAALDRDTVRADARSFRFGLCEELAPGRRPPACPQAPEAAALLAVWFEEHPTLAAAAEAFAAPGYRSSLEGAATPGDFAIDSEHGWLEPRTWDAIHFYGPLFAWRAALAFHRGDAAAALDDLARLARCRDAALREPGFIGLHGASYLQNQLLVSGAFQSRLDLWPADALEAADRDAAALPGRFEAAWPDVWAADLIYSADYVGAMPPTFFRDWIGTELRLPGVCAPYAAWWQQHGRLPWYRLLADGFDGVRRILAIPPGPERAAAHRDLADRLQAAQEGLPRSVRLVWEPLGGFPRQQKMLLCVPRTRADFVRAAIAVERYRRARGTLPPDLDALVPDFLPGLPTDAFTGEPLAYTPAPDGFTLVCPDPAVRPGGDTPIFFPLPVQGQKNGGESGI